MDLAGLVRSFAGLPTPHEANAEHLEEWITAVRSVDLPHLRAYTRRLDQDRNAARAALTLPVHNGGTEGVNIRRNG